MSEYIHGTEPEEQQRLTLLNTILLNEGTLRELRLKEGEWILDVGSGLGQLSRAMARAAKTRVIGIERSEEQIAEASRQAKAEGEEHLVEFRQGDAIDLPLKKEEWGSFDVAHSRFLLEHVPDPLAVVRQMARAVKSAGRIILQDDDHDVLRLHPEPAGFSVLWSTYQRTYDRLGNDPIVGRRLVQLLQQAGARPLRNAWIFFGSCSGDPNWSVFIDNLIAVVNGAAQHILDVGTMDERQLDEAVDAIQAWSHRPDAAIWYAVALAEGRKP